MGVGPLSHFQPRDSNDSIFAQGGLEHKERDRRPAEGHDGDMASYDRVKSLLTQCV